MNSNVQCSVSEVYGTIQLDVSREVRKPKFISLAATHLCKDNCNRISSETIIHVIIKFGSILM